jgi:hypothetical protein
MENPFTHLWTVHMGDWGRGLVVAIMTAPLTIIYQSVSAGSLTFDWKAIITTAITGGLAYIMKNLATGKSGNLLTDK